MKIIQTLALMPLAVLTMAFPKVVSTSGKINNEVKFADPNLEAFIRDIIRKPSGTIYKNDIEGLVSLTIDYRAYTRIDRETIRSIKNLAGLEHFSGLNYLEIKNTSVNNLSPLSALTSLECLILDSNRITDLSPIVVLQKLQYLSVKENQVKNLSPLSRLTSLSQLYIQDNEIIDIWPLANLTNLVELNLCQNRISDINPLSGLSGLDELYLEYNAIRDLSPLLENKFRLSSRWKHDHITYYASGIKIYINGNPLSDSSINEHIPRLIETGIVVNY